MYKRVFSAAFVTLLAGHAFALDNSVIRQLEQLEPEEQLEQRCDIEAMSRIRSEQSGFNPDKVIAYTFSPPDVDGNSIHASGAVVRSRGKWYRLKYQCETGEKHLKVKKFDYEMGALIPRNEWQKYYLYD